MGWHLTARLGKTPRLRVGLMCQMEGECCYKLGRRTAGTRFGLGLD
jgi:hypothetical protein